MHLLSPITIGKEGRNRKEDEVFNYLMTLSSNLIGQSGSTELGPGLSSPQHSSAEDIYRDVSSWDAFTYCSLCSSQVTDLPAAVLLEQEGILTETVFHCLPSAQQPKQRIERSCVDKLYSRLKLRINTSLLPFPSLHLILMEWENAECC